MKRIALALAALLPSVLLAIGIETVENDVFFAIGTNLPTRVAAKDTPGSSTFIRHALATTNEAGALFAALAANYRMMPESAASLYAAFVRFGSINTNDLYELYRGFDRYGAVTTNEAHSFYAAMATNGIITAAGASVLSNRFDASVTYLRDWTGEIVDHYGTISTNDAMCLYGSLARKDHLTVTNGAALYACFDGYCQRVYYMNCGRSNGWDQAEYGGLTPYDFRFPADFGNRTNANFRAIGFRTNMQALASNVSFDRFSISRPSWPSGTIYVGSACLERTPGALLDPYGIGGLLSWSSTIPDGRMVVLRSLLCDSTYNPNPVSNIWTAAWKSIGHGEPYLDTLPTTNSCAVTYEDAVTNTIGPSSWNVTDITNIPRRLDGINAWMGAAAQGLTFIDRAYDFVSIGKPTNQMHTSYSAYRTATYSNCSTYHVSAYGETGYLSDTIDISSNDWTVSQCASETNDTVSLFYGGAHFRDLKISNGSSVKQFTVAGTDVGRCELTASEIEDILDSIIPSEEPSTNRMELFAEDSGSMILFEAQIGEGYPYVISSYIPQSEFDISGISIVCGVRNAYSVYRAAIPHCGIGEVRMTRAENEYAKLQKFSMLGSVLVNASATVSDEYDGEPDTKFEYGQSVGSDYSRAMMSNEVDRFAAEMDVVMSARTKAIKGDFENARVYLPVGPSDVLSHGTIRYVDISTSVPDSRWYGKAIRDESGRISVTDFYEVTSGGVTNVIPWSGVIMSARTLAVPRYETSDTATRIDNPNHRAVGDVKSAIMTDFEFGALRNDL